MLNFETLNDARLLKALRDAEEWLSDFTRRTPPRWISMLGVSGAGKTFLAKQLWTLASHAANWSRCDFIHKPIYWPRFVRDLKAGDAYGLRDDLARWPVLFIDDIFADRDATGFSTDELNMILGCRMGKWTILTANLDIEKIAAIETRISSRMNRDGNRVVNFGSLDFATRKDSKR